MELQKKQLKKIQTLLILLLTKLWYVFDTFKGTIVSSISDLRFLGQTRFIATSI